MRSHTIALIPGDGVGREVLVEGVRVLRRVAEVAGAFRLEVREHRGRARGTSSTRR